MKDFAEKHPYLLTLIILVLLSTVAMIIWRIQFLKAAQKNPDLLQTATAVQTSTVPVYGPGF